MKKRSEILATLFVILFFSIVIFLFFKTPIAKPFSAFLEGIILPVQTFFYTALSPSVKEKDKEEKVQANIKLQKELESLLKENKALRDQFETTNIRSSQLIPAKVVGLPRFVPGISPVEILIIDKGQRDGVEVEQPVIVKDSLIGVVKNTSAFYSEVYNITHRDVSLSAKTTKNNSRGILTGKGRGEMILDKVLSSDSLTASDIVVTAGDTDSQGKGVPQGLIIGIITSVDKNPSALFQSGKVKNTIDPSKQSIIFVVKK